MDYAFYLACLFWSRRRRCTPVRGDVASSPSVSLWVTARISTKPNLNASQVILKYCLTESLQHSPFSMLITVYLLYNQLCVFDFVQPVVKPTPSQMSSMRAFSAARVNSHLQNREWSRCEEHMWIIALDAHSLSILNSNRMSPGCSSLYVSFVRGM